MTGSAELNLCDQRKALLTAEGPLLVLGGPGSGKTTISLVKAAEIIASGLLQEGQKVLFLSFARATTTRVAEQARKYVAVEARSRIQIETYHGFTWSILQTHGYLLIGYRDARLLSPPDAAAKCAGLPQEERTSALRKALAEEGLIGFDLFAELAANLFSRSPRIRDLVCDCYPVIILDEFQDTNPDEWSLIQHLGRTSTLIALADPDQRIYEFRGADPARIKNFEDVFSPTKFDFGHENNRSNGRDIVDYGNDILRGTNVARTYNDVKITQYGFNASDSYEPIKYAVLRAMRRLIEPKRPDWSLAVLVSSRDMMLRISDCLSREAGSLPSIPHDVAIDPAGPALAAVLIGGLVEGHSELPLLEASLLTDVIAHIRGRKGGDASQADLGLAAALEGYQRTGSLRGKNRLQLLDEVRQIAASRFALALTGDPEDDWRAVRAEIDAATHAAFRALSADARFIRLLQRGAVLRESLSERWRERSSYVGAKQIVTDALLQEHFSASTRTLSGVNVMTIHKAKGKEFDEVIVFEGIHTGRLLRNDASQRDVDQAKLNLRVAVTRARERTSILTPSWKPSPLIC